MILKDVPFAEESLSLPASERAGLARLLVESLEGDPVRTTMSAKICNFAFKSFSRVPTRE